MPSVEPSETTITSTSCSRSIWAASPTRVRSSWWRRLNVGMTTLTSGLTSELPDRAGGHAGREGARLRRSVVTTLPAPTQLSRPMVTPGIRIERAPIHTLSSTMIGSDGGRSRRRSGSTRWKSLSRIIVYGPMWQSAPIRTSSVATSEHPKLTSVASPISSTPPGSDTSSSVAIVETSCTRRPMTMRPRLVTAGRPRRRTRSPT